MDRLNSSVFDGKWLNRNRGKLRSIIFPLFGSRDRWRDAHDVANGLVMAATNYLEDHPGSQIEKVYFLAFTDVDKTLCETAFRMNEWIEEEEK